MALYGQLASRFFVPLALAERRHTLLPFPVGERVDDYRYCEDNAW
jgi:hypothetical protein